MTTPGYNVSSYLDTKPTFDSALSYTLGPLQYTNFYYKDPAIQDPAAQLLLGQPPLPGNRTFIDVQRNTVMSPGSAPSPSIKQCYDASGKPHNLSVLIDTVQNNSDPKGLLYSLYASVQDFNNGISKIDASRNPYLCKNSPGSAKYVLKESFSQDQEYQHYPPGNQEEYNSFKSRITERRGGVWKSEGFPMKGLESFRNPEDFEEVGFGRPGVPPKEYEKNPLYDPIVWFYFCSVVLILCYY